MIRLLSGPLLIVALGGPALSFDLRSSTAPGATPPLDAPGEIAINRADRTLFFKNVDGSIGRGSLLNALPAARTCIEAGDCSALSVKAAGAPFARTNAARAADVVHAKDFGAVTTGTSHPLRERYSTLAAARADCPKALSLDDEIDWCAIQTAADQGQAVDLGNGRYFVNRTVNVTKDGVTLKGNGRSITEVYRSGDFGPTFLFSNNTATPLRGVGVESFSVTDAGTGPGTVMTLANSRYSVVFDNTHRAKVKDFLVYSGNAGSTGSGLAMLGSIDFLVQDLIVGLYTGAPAGRQGLRIGPTAIPGVAFPNGGGRNEVTSVDIGGGRTTYNSSKMPVGTVSNLEDSILIDAGDGLWMNDVHTNFNSQAGIHLRPELKSPLLNTRMSMIMLDSAAGHGLLIDGPGVVNRLYFEGWASGAAIGSANSYGVLATAEIKSAVFNLSAVDSYGAWCVYFDNPKTELVTINLGQAFNCSLGSSGHGGVGINRGTAMSLNAGQIGSGDKTMDYGILVGPGANTISIANPVVQRNAYGIVMQRGADKISVSGGSVAGNGTPANGLVDQTSSTAQIRVRGLVGAADVNKN